METYLIYGILFFTTSVIVPVTVVIVASLLRRRKYPEKSFKHALMNTLLAPLRWLKLGPFKEGRVSIEKSCQYAVKKTGLTDFGGNHFLNVYNLIIQSPVHQSQILSNLGYISARIEMNLTFVRRLKFIDYLKKNPDIVKVPVPGPVFVMGLPRTGTTFIHRLLSLDPQVRAPLLWELFAPVPGVPGTASKEEMDTDLKRRSVFVKKLIATRMSMGDKALLHIHEIGYDLPEECLISLSDEIPSNPSLFYSSYMEANTFVKAMNGEVINNAYLYYRKVLQLLSYQLNERENPRRWVLKCPIHLFFTKAIANAFPDAKLIWTHRDPLSAVPSLCSLLKSFHQVYYENECRDDHRLGTVLKDFTADLLEQAPKDIKESGLPCAHVIYNDLIDDSVNIVKQIYHQFEWNYSKEYDEILRKYLEDNRKNREKLKLKRQKQGLSTEDTLHKYEPEEFGLTAQQLNEGKYAKYKEAFHVPMSKN